MKKGGTVNVLKDKIWIQNELQKLESHKNNMSSAGKKYNAFKQNESSAQIIFSKVLGVMDAQQNRS